MPTKRFHTWQSNLSALLTGQTDVIILTIIDIFSFAMYLHRPHFRLRREQMFRELIYTWLFKGLEIVLVALLGYGIYLIIDGIFAKFWAICGLTIILYYWAILTKPYIDSLRKWIYKKITKDEEDY